MLIPFTAIVFALIGLVLGAGGLWLAGLGGSWYYVFAGLGFLLTAFLLFTRRSVALIVYALLILGTLAWAIWEVGFDWWQLPDSVVHHLADMLQSCPAIQRAGITIELHPARSGLTQLTERDDRGAVLIDPASQSRPLTQQRLVRDLGERTTQDQAI